MCYNPNPCTFPSGICPRCDTYYTYLIIWFLFMSRSLAQRTAFTPLPKTITPPNAAPPSQPLSNSSSGFEVFMDTNDPTFQKSSTCLALQSVWARGKSMFQRNIFHQKSCVVLWKIVWSRFAGCPWDVTTPTVWPQRQRHAMKNRCIKNNWTTKSLLPVCCSLPT